MITKANVLVSIVVITYNSAKYVIETLESVKAQTYKNLELIISDDGSLDNTIELCRNWLNDNQQYFVRTHINTVEKNSGIPANCNRGVENSRGEWIKLIAGDDVLYSDCIEKNLNILFNDNNINILQTQSTPFNNILSVDNLLQNIPTNDNKFFKCNSNEQYKLLTEKNYVVAPSVIFSRKLYDRVNGFDEDFKLFEDITFWISITKIGAKIFFFQTPTVYYRKHNETAEKASKPYIRKIYANELIQFRKKYTDKEVSVFRRWKHKLRLLLLVLFDEIGINNDSILSRYLYKIVNKLLR